jgi:hypothetical protein
VNATTVYPSPYGQWYGSTVDQYLIPASELNAAGLVAGPLTSIAWDLAAAYTGASLENFEIRIAHTTLTALPSVAAVTCGGLQMVYGPTTYTPPATTGYATITFGTSFVWDGIQNLIIDVRHSNCSVCNGTSSCTTSFTSNGSVNQSTTSYISSINFHADNNCTINSCTPSITGTSYSQRPNMKLGGIVGSPITYTWTGGSTGLTYSPCPTAATTYTVVASVPSGCSSSASVGVAYTPIADPVISPANPSICPGNSTNLDAGAGFTNYSWSDGTSVVGTTQTINVSPASTTTYTVTVDNGALCTKSASTVVTVANLPAPTVTASGSTTICSGGSVTLDAGAGYDTYSWSDGSTVVGTSQTLVVSASGTYTVTVTLNGCPASDAGTTVTVNPNPPTAAITPAGPINICDNGSDSPITLTSDITGAGAGATIIWNQDGNPTTSTISVSAGDIDLLLNGGTFGYNFTVTNSFGCSATSNMVTVNEVPCATGTTLYAKLFLEGYYSGGGDMNTSGSGGCYYVTGQSANPLDADVISVSAMASTSPYALVQSQNAILKTNGTVQVSFTSPVAAGTSYYIRVTHRNHLETWSAAPVMFSATTALAPYDFSSAASQAYLSNQADLGDGNYALFGGDISDAGSATVCLQDGIIESQDYGDMENAVYVTLLGYVCEDITGDGIVESADYGLMENNVYFTRVVQRP